MAKLSTSPQVAQRAPSARRSLWASKKGQDQIIRALAIFICIIGVLVILFPIGWMISTSLKTRIESIKIPPTVFPDVPQWNNYYEALVRIAPFGRYFYNTMFYALSVMIAELISCS